ncbi:hypothetical protein IV203_018335 [Nitzschia inconspicua]|uniref:Uncharacterized protein n=1 Tax=Nitzschia inconspicua TaxID=303405 RepID=A0A9K3Q5H7_9STRA|nr:hypothetical protein IV203_018335 [Nitzschia inconspicua]
MVGLCSHCGKEEEKGNDPEQRKWEFIQPQEGGMAERRVRRKVSTDKQKTNQIIQASKMMKLRQRTTSGLRRGAVVRMKVDPREKKNATVMLGIVWNVSGSGAGGIQVATEYGMISKGKSGKMHYVPADKYSVPPIQDLALDGGLLIVRHQILTRRFDETKCNQVTIKQAHDLREAGYETDYEPLTMKQGHDFREGSSLGKKKKGCRCTHGKCTDQCDKIYGRFINGIVSHVLSHSFDVTTD